MFDDRVLKSVFDASTCSLWKELSEGSEGLPLVKAGLKQCHEHVCTLRCMCALFSRLPVLHCVCGIGQVVALIRVRRVGHVPVPSHVFSGDPLQPTARERDPNLRQLTFHIRSSFQCRTAVASVAALVLRSRVHIPS